MQVDPRHGDVAVAVVLLAAALFFMWGAWQMPAGTFAVPGPAVAPLTVGALLALTALSLLMKTLLAVRARKPRTVVHFRLPAVVLVSGALVGVAFAFERAGFIITMSVFLFVIVRAFSRFGSLRSALLAVGITLAAQWIFGTVLGVNLPRVAW